MPFVEEIVTLTVDGQVMIGWQDVSVNRSQESAEISFNLGATNPSWSDEAKRLRHGSAVEIRTSAVGGRTRPGRGDLLCAGNITGYGAKYAKTKEVTIEGKSKAADAVDCHPVKHKTGRFENKTLLDIAKELDEVRCGFKTDQQLTKIPKVQRQPHDTIFQTLEREARRLGLMLAGQPDGSINITRAGTKRHAGALILGQSPVEEMDVKIKCGDKFSHYVARGQRAKGVGKDNLRQEETERDPSVKRNRPYLIIPEGDWTKKELKKRLRWERLRRASFGTTITVKVASWRDEAGQLWEPGRLMAIVNEPEDIDGDYALQTANLRQGGQEGTVAYLTFVDPKAAGGKEASDKSDGVFDPGGGIDDEGEGEE
ncbi:phage baseplate assembly protein [Methylobacterium sp. A49B]